MTPDPIANPPPATPLALVRVHSPTPHHQLSHQPSHQPQSRIPAPRPATFPLGLLLFLVAIATCFAAPSAKPPAANASDTLPAAHRAFFETKIRPVLVKHCYSCHSADAKKIGGRLFLDTRDGLLVGGESGPALIAGRPDESLLIQSLRYQDLEMPPKDRLPEAVINDFVEWVKLGAPDPRIKGAKEVKPASSNQGAERESLWSMRPVANPAAPTVRNSGWAWDPVDRFVLARAEAAGLTPVADATPATLIRRLFYDLTGLPPTLAQVNAFVADHAKSSRRAVEQWVDQLLASPHFGERWGRHWLDVARFGESNGNDGLSRNPSFPHAWRYRDYVIQSFNAGVPYDRFLTEQIAGDLLPAASPAERDRHLIATGFLALGSKPAKAMNDNFDMDVVADQIDAVGSGILGLSVACARCHDHKHDPIPTRDYYALAGIFTSTETLWGTAAKEPLTAPATPLHELQTAPRVLPPPAGKPAKVAAAGNTTAAAKAPKAPPPPPPGTPLAMGVRDRPAPADCKVNINGESKKLGAVVPRGFLSACGTNTTSIAIDHKQSGRLQLAQWLTHPGNPLTSRVIANRVWLHLFGHGLVRTPDDFGIFGDRPTHPELLDHLAGRLIADGWSLKRLIRSLVLTRTYQLGSQTTSTLLKADPDNELLCRHSRRRLDAESLRDSVLVASGQLNWQPGQGSLIQHMDVLINKLGSLHRPSPHRSVYLCMLRNSMPPDLLAFNLPDGTRVTGRRDVTTLPAQSLFLLNSPFLVAQSRHLAARVLDGSAADDDRARLRRAYEFAHSREPTPAEIERANQLLREAATDLRSANAPDQTPTAVWALFCQALLASNEFRYVD